MNKSCTAISVLLMLCGLTVGIVAPRDGFSTPPSELEGRCNKTPTSSKGHTGLLQYFGWLLSASDEERTTQYACANRIATNGKPRDKLVLALVISLPDTEFTDLARANLLLGEYLEDAEDEDLEERNLASLMLALLDEVERLEAQLEQLKAIEQDITETEQSVNVPAPAPAPNDEYEENDTPSR